MVAVMSSQAQPTVAVVSPTPVGRSLTDREGARDLPPYSFMRALSSLPGGSGCRRSSLSSRRHLPGSTFLRGPLA